MSSYNSIPYESLPVSYTYLPHLAALGKLYGLNSVDPEQCRVLEIGCAEGNNIIPMAWYYPESQFVGIDLSDGQISTGQRMITRLSLNNIQLYTQDVATLDSTAYEKFDYILLHGVFSWVPRELQNTILETVQALLSENGIAYISYNTYPGWHTQMVLRDALLLYCGDPDPLVEIKRIPKAIEYFKRFFATADNDFSSYYIKRLATLEKHPKKYLYHEFLETNNHPLYFADFVKLANKNGLQYLTDTLQVFDNTELLGQQRNAFLSKIDDRIERLQYMDFMINQRFRRSLLCHRHHSIRERFTPEHMTDIAYRAKLYSKREPTLNSSRTCQFYQAKDPHALIKLSHPVSKAAVQILSSQYPSSIHYMDLLQQACQRVADHKGMSFLNHIEPFYQEFYLLVNNDWISMDNKPKHFSPLNKGKQSTIPKLTFQYAVHAGFLPTFLQQAIDIDEIDIHILKQINHCANENDLLERTLKSLATIEIEKNPSLLTDSVLGKLVMSNNMIKKYRLKKRIEILLESLKNNAILEQ